MVFAIIKQINTEWKRGKMKVTLLSHTPNPENLIAAAAKLCYSNASIDELLSKISDESASDFVGMLSEIGHESPTEHINFTFAIQGVSRALLAQITRHRIASYSVQSQRYVKENAFGYVIPPEIEKIPLAKEKFEKAMQIAQLHYDELTQILKAEHYNTLIQNAVEEKQANRQAEKQAIEDARFVLPNACDTKMILTMNARSLHNFFKHRGCNRAQWEIKAVADEMLKLVVAVAPTLFRTAGPSCVRGICHEGKMTCGQINEVRQYYIELKESVKHDKT